MRSLSVVVLALALAACDSQAPQPAPSGSLAAPALGAAVKSGEAAYAATSSASVGTEGESIVLTIEGESFVFGAGEAYLLGQVLARAGFETLEPELAAVIRPGGGDKCEPPSPGAAVALIGDRLYGGDGKCPPPPPPIFMETDFLSTLLGGEVEVIEATEGLEWMDIPGGYVAAF